MPSNRLQSLATTVNLSLSVNWIALPIIVALFNAVIAPQTDDANIYYIIKDTSTFNVRGTLNAKGFKQYSLVIANQTQKYGVACNLFRRNYYCVTNNLKLPANVEVGLYHYKSRYIVAYVKDFSGNIFISKDKRLSEIKYHGEALKRMDALYWAKYGLAVGFLISFIRWAFYLRRIRNKERHYHQS